MNGQDLINAQNNNATIQVWVEDNLYCEYIVTKDLLKVQINIDILDVLTEDKTVLDIHNTTSKMCIVLMKLIEGNYSHLVNIYDYSILNVSRYTDDVTYGSRMSLWLHIPSPIDVCSIENYVDGLNKYDEYIDDDIDIKYPSIDINDIDINPIKLKKNE